MKITEYSECCETVQINNCEVFSMGVRATHDDVSFQKFSRLYYSQSWATVDWQIGFTSVKKELDLSNSPGFIIEWLQNIS